MPDLKCDQEILKLFGPEGLEAIIRVNLKYVNILRVEQGMPELTYEEYRAEIETEINSIQNPNP